jgi:hypothetical protein
MKVVVAMTLVGACIILSGAVLNKQYFGCDRRFPCISYDSTTTTAHK